MRRFLLQFFRAGQFLCRSKNYSTAENELISPSEIIKKFKCNRIAIVEGHACLTIDCPFCDVKTKRNSLFVNKTTGYFTCNDCKYSGSWKTLEKCLTRKTISKDSELLRELHMEKCYANEWKNIKKNGQEIHKLDKETCLKILAKLDIPKLTQYQLSQLDCVYDKSNSLLHFPLIGIGSSIVGIKSLSTCSDFETTQPSKNASGIVQYRDKQINNNDTAAVLVPSIRDLLCLMSQKAAPVVVCLPHGCQSLPQEVLPNFENFKKLILWFGKKDALSYNSPSVFARKLDEKRCYLVRPTESQSSPQVAVRSGHNLKAIMENVQLVCHKSITTFQSLRQDVYSDLQNHDKVQGTKWKRYPKLNNILKGHRRGEFTILTGATGSGKTTFMSEYSLDLALQGVNTLWGSFEIRNTRLARTMLQQMAGVPLDKHLDKYDTYADDFEKLPIYFMTFHGQESLEVVMEAVEHQTYVHDVSHVIIDNLQFMMGLGTTDRQFDRYFKQDQIIAAFRTFATKFNCHVTLVIHPRKERDSEDLTTASIFGSAKATQEADNVLIIQDQRLKSVRGKQFLQVTKNRFSGDLGMMPLDFDKDSLSYASKKKPKTDDEKK